MTIDELYEKAGVRRLPVDPAEIADVLGIKVVSYKTAAEFFGVNIQKLYMKYPLGFSFRCSDVWGIALNENSCGKRRQRFTAAHELAHCILGHLNGSSTPSQSDERSADSFAAELLAPLVVLNACGVSTSEEIAQLCGISRAAADIRLTRLAERERGGFFASKEERRISERFAEFIAAEQCRKALSA